MIDNEARSILKKSMAEAEAILEANRDKMVRVAELLLERETITSVDMEAICGKRKGRSPTNYSEIIRDVSEREKKEREKKEQVEKEEEKEKKEEEERKKKEEMTNEETTSKSDTEKKPDDANPSTDS